MCQKLNNVTFREIIFAFLGVNRENTIFFRKSQISLEK